MYPWEKRLKDLWVLLERCHATYMEPELFRLNVNQVLQTSRTVTFIIQKNKDTIPDFDAWYSSRQTEWHNDPLMKWAKDSRNKIEKEGDLELHSSLELSLFYSYFEEEDIKIETGQAELLQAGTKRLIRFAQKSFPSAIVKRSAVKIERKWVANSLPQWELLQALTYVYAELYRTCESLAKLLSQVFEETIPEPSELHSIRENARRVAYLKLSDLDFHYQHTTRMKRDDAFIEAKFSDTDWSPLRKMVDTAKTIDDTFEAAAEMAKQSFEYFGYHVPMLFTYDCDLKIVDMISTEFKDQIDKYIFWRNIADRVVATKASLITCIGEAWIRKKHPIDPYDVKNAPIIGEQLFVTALDRSGQFRSKSWKIIRPNEQAKPTLQMVASDDTESALRAPFYFAPIFKAFAIPYPGNFKYTSASNTR